MINGDNTIKNWLAIATIIVPVITAFMAMLAPSLAEMVKARMAQPKPSPDEKNPKNLSQRSGGRVSRHFKSWWSQYLGIALNVSLLAWLLSVDAPLTRWTVVEIAVCVGMTIFQFIIILVAKLADRLADHIVELFRAVVNVSERTVRLGESLNEQGRNSLETFRAITESVEILAKRDAPPETPEDSAGAGP
jgi:hypothetical protein